MSTSAPVPVAGRAVGRALVVALVIVLGACSGDGGGAPGAAPGTAAAGQGAGMTSTSTTAPPPRADRNRPTITEPAADLPGYNVRRPADPAAIGAPLPVVVWANGGCVRHDATWSTLLDRWAAAGFVVVSITAPPEGVVPESPVTSAADQAAAIDWAEQQDAQPDGPLAGHLDLDRVVAAGNSCGGITSLGLAATDPRVAAVFVLSGSSVGPVASEEQAAAVMGKVTVPVGFVVGGPEDIASAAAAQDYALLGTGIPALVANRSAGDHRSVSTDPAILTDVATIAINWMDLALDGNAAALDALTTNPCGACAPGTWSVTSKDLEAALVP